MKFFVIAGEASGDALGAALMAGLKALAPGVQFEGVGGPLMEAEGLVSRFPMEELSVMGLWEVLPKYRALKRRIAETAAAAAAARPDALITIDSPDFCLRVARAARDALPDLRTIHYVAPSVWAWRPGRAAKMAPFIDHVLALLPFEPPYMTAAGMSCDFVGHPVVAEPRATPAEAAAFRETQMIGPEQPLVLCLPGSRRGEVRWPVAPIVVETAADKRAAFAAADLALAASGTVSLELAAARVPMVIGYDMAPLSRIVISRLLRTDTVTLVNLVSETRMIPEFVGSHCRPGPMAAALLHLLEDDGARAAQLAAMELTMQRLGEGGEAPGLRAARSVLAALQGGKTRGRRHRTPGVFGR
ncbi:MAG: lipid-A-disaccharide synthase [Alphaproteobacteria bacterium HGW-Alphaproteobacteria-4]|nr:MAG: lipid-A-disaccharide synthase [Alphaproteobacteria bacterium HGW-Alphaproteobacteria-4]